MYDHSIGDSQIVQDESFWSLSELDFMASQGARLGLVQGNSEVDKRVHDIPDETLTEKVESLSVGHVHVLLLGYDRYGGYAVPYGFLLLNR